MPTKPRATPKPKPAESQSHLRVPEPPSTYQQPALRSTLPDYVALRLAGITYLVAPGAVETFKRKHGRHEYHDEGFDE